MYGTRGGERRGPGTVTAIGIAVRRRRYTPEPIPPTKEKNSLLCGWDSLRVVDDDDVKLNGAELIRMPPENGSHSG